MIHRSFLSPSENIYLQLTHYDGVSSRRELRMVKSMEYGDMSQNPAIQPATDAPPTSFLSTWWLAQEQLSHVP